MVSKVNATIAALLRVSDLLGLGSLMLLRSVFGGQKGGGGRKGETIKRLLQCLAKTLGFG